MEEISRQKSNDYDEIYNETGYHSLKSNNGTIKSTTSNLSNISSITSSTILTESTVQTSILTNLNDILDESFKMKSEMEDIITIDQINSHIKFGDGVSRNFYKSQNISNICDVLKQVSENEIKLIEEELENLVNDIEKSVGFNTFKFKPNLKRVNAGEKERLLRQEISNLEGNSA